MFQFYEFQFHDSVLCSQFCCSFICQFYFLFCFSFMDFNFMFQFHVSVFKISVSFFSCTFFYIYIFHFQIYGSVFFQTYVSVLFSDLRFSFRFTFQFQFFTGKVSFLHALLKVGCVRFYLKERKKNVRLTIFFARDDLRSSLHRGKKTLCITFIFFLGFSFMAIIYSYFNQDALRSTLQ